MRKTEELRGMKIEYFMPRKMSNENEMETYKSDSSNFHGCRRTYMDVLHSLQIMKETFSLCVFRRRIHLRRWQELLYILWYLHIYISTNHKQEIMRKNTHPCFLHFNGTLVFSLAHYHCTDFSFIYSFNCFRAYIFHHSCRFIAMSFWLSFSLKAFWK